MASKASDRCLSAPLLPARPAALLTKAERSQEQRFAGSGHPFVTGNCISKAPLKLCLREWDSLRESCRHRSVFQVLGRKHGSAAESSDRAAWAALPAEVSYAALKCSRIVHAILQVRACTSVLVLGAESPELIPQHKMLGTVVQRGTCWQHLKPAWVRSQPCCIRERCARGVVTVLLPSLEALCCSPLAKFWNPVEPALGMGIHLHFWRRVTPIEEAFKASQRVC
ncbi:hypothetical protein Anapl_06837 [Anas platyrhynchos]|uniref:Uncharacterized protein n=1 Tax=Anas platyrhynchos TaxID=8839 RepID=R0K5C5_ANAPL|nr:hypothetical protein Anapl_06837 [Anas platyrhynchos]